MMKPTDKPPDADCRVEVDPQVERTAARDVPGRESSLSDEVETNVFVPQAPAQLAKQSHKLEPTLQDFPSAFGRYEVRGILGRGGYGTVLIGHDTQLNRPVAIKVPHGNPSPKQLEEFLKEARRLALLRHPGIVTVHDIGVQAGLCFLVSDYLEGESLARRLERGRIDWCEAAHVVAAVADALAHAHAQSVVHRDVKPGNIMLTPDGRPVLLDFGLGLSDADVTAPTDTVTGTTAYMSPEQVRGFAHRIDGRTDIFSLGCVLYRMVCGRNPFRSPDAREVMRQIAEEEAQPPRQLVPELPPEFEKIILRTMAKRATERYTTARDLAHELRRLLQSYGVGEEVTSEHSSQRTSPTISGSRPTGSQVRPAVASGSKSGMETPSTLRRARAAELRQVTVVICNCGLDETDASLEPLDPELQQDLMQTYRELCSEQVGAFGGTIVPASGAETVACFGFPVAREDAAHRAIRAGLKILERVADLGARFHRQHGRTISAWVAIHSGPSVVGDTGGEGSTSISLIGDARNVAARLETISAPNAVTISGATHRLVAGYFACESAGTQQLRGIPLPIEMFRVLAETGTRNRVELADPANLTPLIGRETELAILRDRWEQAAEGMGQVVLLIGEPGLGKSRLIREIKQHLSDRDATASAAVIEWRCSPYHVNTDFFAATDFLERLLDFQRDDSPPTRQEKLVRHLEACRLATPEVVGLFAALLSVPLDERYPLLALSPQRQMERTQEVLLDWLRESASAQPVLFIVEDLHWVDPSSLALLNRHVERGFTDRVLTLLTFRPDFQTPWRSLAHQTQVALNRLTKRQIGEMVRSRTGVKNVPEAVVAQLAERTDGVPLFVEEFTKLVQESGVLTGSAEGAAAHAAMLATIPTTLQDLLLARLDRIDSNIEVVQMAATLGREFSYELLHAVLGLSHEDLQVELDKVVQAELLFSKGRPPQCSYLFKHALIQDAAYNTLLKKKRQQFHKTIADVLERDFPAAVESQPEWIARHCTAACDAARAIAYWLKAGHRSQARSANQEAISHYSHGLELVRSLPESADRDRAELALQLPLGVTLLAAHGYAAPGVGPVFDRAYELCRTAGDPVLLFYIAWGRWAWRIVRSELSLSRGLADEIFALAESLGDDGWRCEAHYVQQVAIHYSGDFALARRHGEESVARHDPQRCQLHAQGTGQDVRTASLSFLACSLWSLGYPDQALARARQAVDVGREIQHPMSLSFALHHCVTVLLHARMWKAAAPLADEALRIATEQGFALWTGSSTFHRGLCKFHLGDRAGLDLMRQGLELFAGTGARVVVPSYHALLAEAHLQTGDHAAADRSLDEAFRTAAEYSDQNYYLAEMHRLRGELLRVQSPDQPAAAEASFQQACEVARSQQAKSLELRATVSLCQLYRQQGRSVDARQALDSILGWFTEGFETPDFVAATTLLRELNS